MPSCAEEFCEGRFDLVYSLKLKYYVSQMLDYSNDSLSLSLMLKPFNIEASGEVSHYLVIGHLLDDLIDQLGEESVVDPLDIAASAWELGYEPAKQFLEEGPVLIFQLFRADFETSGELVSNHLISLTTTAQD